jgi:opine dehydrogenase
MCPDVTPFNFSNREILLEERSSAENILYPESEYLGEEFKEENKETTIAVLGAGHGGQAMAGHLALKGFTVNLFNRTYDHILPIARLGGIELKGVVRGFGELNKITSNMEEAISDADLIMVVVPAVGHRYMAENCAPYLKKGQVILLNPGRTFGALEFYNILKKQGKHKDVVVAEAETFIYASRRTAPAQAKIFSVKSAVPIAALPALKTYEAMPIINKAFPQFVPAESTLETSLNNMACIFHPPITLLNTARIENTQGDFQYYIEGVSPAVGTVLEEIDHERINLLKSLGVKPISALEWLKTSYSSIGRNLVEAIQNNPAYRGIYSPRTVFHRYLTEDVPMSMVPIASLAQMYNIATTTLSAVIRLCSVIAKKDFIKEGRTVESLEIKGLTIEQLRKLVMEGS